MRRFQVGDYMVKSPFVVGPDQSIDSAFEFLQECGIRHLPVMEDEELVGIVSERDLKEARSLPLAKSLLVGDVMKTDVYVATQNASISYVCKEMANNKIGSAIILDYQDRILGIFTTTDALHLLAEVVEDGAIEDFLAEDENLEELTLAF